MTFPWSNTEAYFEPYKMELLRKIKKAINSFRKKTHLRCLTSLRICLWNTCSKSTIQSLYQRKSMLFYFLIVEFEELFTIDHGFVDHSFPVIVSGCKKSRCCHYTCSKWLNMLQKYVTFSNHIIWLELTLNTCC